MVKVGIQLAPQCASMSELRAAWRAADEAGVDSLWLWDHFFPIEDPYDGAHFEGYTALAAMAADTVSASVGLLVTSVGYRNPDLVADMIRTVDHICGGRAVLGIGAGWFERDYDEYGYDFGTAPSRLADLGRALPRIRRRLERLNPPPVQQPLPILIGGGGEKVTLRLVAEHAQQWNSFGPPEVFARKNAVLDDWCARVGRDPGDVERTVALPPEEVGDAAAYVDAGARHLIVLLRPPYDLGPVRRLLQQHAPR